MADISKITLLNGSTYNLKDASVPSWAKASSKPSYTANEVGAIPTTQKGAASGVAELDSNGKVPSTQLPSYVDDVLEYSAKSSFPTTGETGKIYVDTSTNLTYRWSGTAYVEISPSLALGETSSTAYRGDRGKTAYDHASAKGSAYSSGLYKITTNSEGHVTAATAVAKADITALGIPSSDTNTTYSLTQDSSDGHKITLTPSSGTAQTITIPDNNTDTKVTSAANHYTPSRDTSADKSASASGATAAWSIDVVKGVTVQTDGKGHVTGVAVTSGKIPGNPNTDTHRVIQVNGTQALGNNTTALNLKAGSNVTITDGGSGAITIAATDTKYTAATAAPGNISTSGSQGSSTNYARQDHTHGISLATGDSNGQVKIAGSNVSVKGLGSAAYTNSTAYVAKSGDTMTGDLLRSAATSTVIKPDAASFYASPVPGSLWHDLFAFCRVATPTYYTSSNGTSWTQATLEKRLFTHQEVWGQTTVLSNSIRGSRWVWNTSAFSWSTGEWLILGVSYSSSTPSFDVVLDISTDNSSWTELCHATGVTANAQPIWIKTSTPGSAAYIRLTLTVNTISDTSAATNLTSIRWLSTRWGNQGQGSELEHPYQWNGTPDLLPLVNNTSSLGNSSLYWKNLYATNINGVAVGSSPKFTDTNTWRGIQDNLTSASTSDSLSANQGKVLKGLVDGKAASGHTHTTSIATSTGTNQLTLAANTKYAITAGGTSYVFTTPPDTNTWRPVSDSVSSTSSSDAASSKAVKTAYDLAASKTANTGTVTSVATGIGLTGGTITGSGTLKAKLRSETALTIDSAAATTTSGKVYPVAVDKSGYLAVNVPWTDSKPVTSVAGKTGAVTLTNSDVGLGNVENKSSATIRGELTKANVTTALGYTPPTTDTNTWRPIGKTSSDAAAGNTVIADSTARTISAGTSSAYSVTNLTADHVVAAWRFSGGYTDSNPPGDITVNTANGSYTIAASNLLASGITMQPIFIKP